jgi:hypothetical protein
MLEEGEIILLSDELQMDDGTWRKTIPQVAGTPAPYPHYTSHRVYRRRKA